MRHAVAGYKLGRDTEHRRAMFRNLAAALFQHGRITTTLPKAKAVQPFVERLITLARRGDLHARRRVIAELRDRELIYVIKGGREEEEVDEKTLVQKLFDDIGPRYADRSGGYTRIIRLANVHRVHRSKALDVAVSGYRLGDGGDLVVLQLVGEEEEDGPKIKGRYSRRRQKQDNRTAFAARLRRAARGETEPAAAEEPPAEEPAPEQPGGETIAEQPAAETPAPEAPAESNEATEEETRDKTE